MNGQIPFPESGCPNFSRQTRKGAKPEVLTVALYPIMPRVNQFKEVIEKAWARLEPDVGIRWCDKWEGGYERLPLPEYDVFVFDALFLTYYELQGWLHHIPLKDVDDFGDFQDYAAHGVLAGEKVLGVPQLGCTTVLFHRADDGPMNEAETLEEVVEAMGARTYCSRVPDGRVGLMTDFSNESVTAGFYLQSLQCDRTELPLNFPYSLKEADPRVMDCIHQVLSMACYEDAFYQAPRFYQRAAWFGQGHGRAYIDYSESLAVIPEDQYDDIAFKVMPWANNREGIRRPVFYTDIISVHTATAERRTTDLAVRLANLMGTAEVIMDCLGPYQGKGPQYLIPARQSVFDDLVVQYPVYDRMQGMMQAIDPVVFDAGPDARRWFWAMQKTLTDEFRNVCFLSSGRERGRTGIVDPALPEPVG